MKNGIQVIIARPPVEPDKPATVSIHFLDQTQPRVTSWQDAYLEFPEAVTKDWGLPPGEGIWEALLVIEPRSMEEET
jgi:hypothetical protein